MEIPDPESVDIALTTTRSVRRRIDDIANVIADLCDFDVEGIERLR